VVPWGGECEQLIGRVRLYREKRRVRSKNINRKRVKKDRLDRPRTGARRQTTGVVHWSLACVSSFREKSQGQKHRASIKIGHRVGVESPGRRGNQESPKPQKGDDIKRPWKEPLELVLEMEGLG